MTMWFHTVEQQRSFSDLISLGMVLPGDQTVPLRIDLGDGNFVTLQLTPEALYSLADACYDAAEKMTGEG